MLSLEKMEECSNTFLRTKLPPNWNVLLSQEMLLSKTTGWMEQFISVFDFFLFFFFSFFFFSLSLFSLFSPVLFNFRFLTLLFSGNDTFYEHPVYKYKQNKQKLRGAPFPIIVYVSQLTERFFFHIFLQNRFSNNFKNK